MGNSAVCRSVLVLALTAEKCVDGSPMDDLRASEADGDIYGDGFKINIGAGTAPNVFLTIYKE